MRRSARRWSRPDLSQYSGGHHNAAICGRENFSGQPPRLAPLPSDEVIVLKERYRRRADVLIVIKIIPSVVSPTFRQSVQGGAVAQPHRFLDQNPMCLIEELLHP